MITLHPAAYPKQSLECVIGIVSRKSGHSPEAIKGPRRSAGLVAARHEVFYRAIRDTKLSSVRIGQLVGGRNHATVLHGASSYALRNNLPPVTRFVRKRPVAAE